MTAGREIKIFPDLEALSQAAAELFLSEARKRIESRGRFTVVLSGGSTPRTVYEMLGNVRNRNAIPWSQVHVFWGDERPVPPDDPDSNYRMANAAFFSKAAIPKENIHRIAGEKEPTQAAVEYEEELRRFFGVFPAFDLVFLGLGDDGHTASLFSQSEALQDTTRWVAAPYLDKLAGFRVTLTLPVFNKARMLIFLVSGSKKREIVRTILQNPALKEPLPAQMIHPESGRTLWLLDQAAWGHA